MQNFNSRLWTHYGSHPCSIDGKNGYQFRIWAPNADQVSLTGDFNNWNTDAHPMIRTQNGAWELFVPETKMYDTYKYTFRYPNGTTQDLADPCAFHTETRPGTASKCYDLDGYSWGDEAWLSWRARHDAYNSPLNIYELHLGSWRRTKYGELLSYREIARILVPYVKEMGFTHIQLLPVTEHLSDESLGYQCTGHFAVTNRFGTPHDFMYLVDELHRAGIGVILDWVAAASPENPFGGDATEEDYLLSSALFWLETYHIDGLRPVAPSGNHVAFLRRLSKTVQTLHPDVLVISEISLPRNTGWTQDFCRYAALDPYFRQFNHQAVTGHSSPTPGILSLSHREVSQSEPSLLGRMPGSIPDKFAAVRAFYTFMLTHPGKKSLIMGSEFGQQDGWRFNQSLDWHLLAQQNEDGTYHRQLHAFFKAANGLYLETPALWQQDFSPEGFRWICDDDAQSNTIAFLRFDKQGRALLTAINFSPVFREGYRIGIPWSGRYEEVFNTDLTDFGGEGRLNRSPASEEIPCHGMERSIQANLPPLSAVIFKCMKKLPSKNNKQVMK